MKHRLGSIVLFFFAILFSVQLLAQPSTQISSVSINGIKVPEDLWTKISIDTIDIISVEFQCKGSPTEGKQISYNVSLDNGDQHNESVQTTTSRTFERLSQGTYAITIKALSFEGEWKAVPASIRVAVNHADAELFRKEFAKADQVVKQTSSIVEESGTFNILMFSIIILLASVVLILLFRQIKILRNISTNIPEAPLLNKLDVASHVKIDTSILDKRIATLQEENRKLREETSRLNAMLKEMSGRTTELDSQNQELEDQINRLSKVKSELEELQNQKDDVFAMIIHDIKNPASLIKNLVDLLRGYDLNADETQEVMQDIVETTTKIVSLSQEFSRVMAMENVELQIDAAESSIAMLIEDVCRRNAASADKKGITITHIVPDNLPSCEFDHQKIEEVLDNLISNAIKFSMSGTSVQVRVTPSKDTMTIEVHDSGLGMSEDDIKKAFKKGMKLSARPTAGENSSGLGLWIVKRLVEAHNGSVWVKSELNKGSIFGVVLPYSQSSVL